MLTINESRFGSILKLINIVQVNTEHLMGTIKQLPSQSPEREMHFDVRRLYCTLRNSQQVEHTAEKKIKNTGNIVKILQVSATES